MSERAIIAKRIDTLVASGKYLEAKSLYNHNFYLFKDELISDIILYDLCLKSSSIQEADALKRIILSSPNAGYFEKMIISFLSGDEENGKLYLSDCEKDQHLQKTQGPLLKYFRETSNHGEFVSAHYKIDWKLSES